MKKIKVAVILLGALSLVACGNSAKENTPEPEAVTEVKSEPVEEVVVTEESEPEWVYFEYDNVVDEYLTEYNTISKNPFTAEQISKGNTTTKAIANNDSTYLEITHIKGNTPYLAISISTNYEDEDTVLYKAFVDAVQSVYKERDEQEIKGVWDELHSSGYMVSDYDYNGVTITYVPHIDTQAVSKPSLDLELPIE